MHGLETRATKDDMPSTINGIGTWYWGKTNVQTRQDVCEFCNAPGELRSYDTGLYFVFFFLPLIPLGRKRIIDECPHCHRHRAASLARWNELRSKAVTEAVTSFESHPNDPVKAADALNGAVAFQAGDEFRRVADRIRKLHPHNADLMALAASGHVHFGHADEAEA